jgi:hypothetical protein
VRGGIVAPTQYNLKMLDGSENRPGRPYGSAGSPVTVSGAPPNLDTGNPEESTLSYHHVVSYSNLRNFWNTLVEKGDVKGCNFLSLLWENIYRKHYVDLYSTYGGRLLDGDVEKVAGLVLSIYEGTVCHGDDAERPDEWDDFTRIYSWLPGNLVVGPDGRCDDPDEEFDQPALSILQDVRERRAEVLSDAEKKIQAYVGGTYDRRLLVPASSALRDVVKYLRAEGYDGKYWVWGERTVKSKVKKGPKVRERR